MIQKDFLEDKIRQEKISREKMKSTKILKAKVLVAFNWANPKDKCYGRDGAREELIALQTHQEEIFGCTYLSNWNEMWVYIQKVGSLFNQ